MIFNWKHETVRFGHSRVDNGWKLHTQMGRLQLCIQRVISVIPAIKWTKKEVSSSSVGPANLNWVFFSICCTSFDQINLLIIPLEDLHRLKPDSKFVGVETDSLI